MCKIILLAVSPGKLSERKKLIEKAWKYFAASGENDGYGALWISHRGDLAWAKSSVPSLGSHYPAYADSFNGAGGDAHIDGDGGWILMHGRTATCGVTLANTHPMLVDDDTAGLIHNGVVDSERYHCTVSSCDSEILLHAIRQDGLEGLADVSGYFAFGALLRHKRKGWQEHIARDDRAPLRLGTPTADTDGAGFATTDEGLRAVGWTPSGSNLKPNTYLVFAGAKLVSMRTLKKKSYQYQRTDLDAKSWEAFKTEREASTLSGFNPAEFKL